MLLAPLSPCRPIVIAQPSSGPGWAPELEHDGYRLQIHVRDGRVRLYTINGADWSKRYPLITKQPARSTAAQSSTQKSSGLGQTVWPIPTRCIAA
jgi:bifunctional non-homologous end joining protein LigD